MKRVFVVAAGLMLAMAGTASAQATQTTQAKARTQTKAQTAPQTAPQSRAAFVDDNGTQMDGDTRDILEMEPLEEKFRNFGWEAAVCNGHDINAIMAAFDKAKNSASGKPKMIIFKTVIGKGASFMEGKWQWHGKVPNKEETVQALKELGAQKTKRLDVVCPGFVADCLETLEEIAQEGREDFQRAGGGEYHYIPCLNDRNDWIHALTDLVMCNLHGWLIEPDAAELEQSRLRALAMGAKK